MKCLLSLACILLAQSLVSSSPTYYGVKSPPRAASSKHNFQAPVAHREQAPTQDQSFEHDEPEPVVQDNPAPVPVSPSKTRQVSKTRIVTQQEEEPVQVTQGPVKTVVRAVTPSPPVKSVVRLVTPEQQVTQGPVKSVVRAVTPQPPTKSVKSVNRRITPQPEEPEQQVTQGPIKTVVRLVTPQPPTKNVVRLVTPDQQVTQGPVKSVVRAVTPSPPVKSVNRRVTQPEEQQEQQVTQAPVKSVKSVPSVRQQGTKKVVYQDVPVQKSYQSPSFHRDHGQQPAVHDDVQDEADAPLGYQRPVVIYVQELPEEEPVLDQGRLRRLPQAPSNARKLLRATV